MAEHTLKIDTSGTGIQPHHLPEKLFIEVEVMDEKIRAKAKGLRDLARHGSEPIGDCHYNDLFVDNAIETALTEVGDAEWNAGVKAAECSICKGSCCTKTKLGGIVVCYVCDGAGTKRVDELRRLKRSKP